ncbi:WW domain-containing protein/FF domain-containing protein, partial [Cephalotus follicularis]
VVWRETRSPISFPIDDTQLHCSFKIQEVQPSTSQAPMSGPAAGGQSGGPLTSNVAPSVPDAAVPISKGSNGSSSDLMQEFAHSNFSNTPGFVVPAFSYSTLPIANTSSGGSQQSSSSTVTNPNPTPTSPMVIQPHVSGLSMPSSSSFSYISQTGVSFSTSQQFQASTPSAQGLMQVGKVTESIAASLQHPIAGQSISFTRGASATVMQSLVPVTKGAPSNADTSTAVSQAGVQQQMYPTYPSLPAMAASPQGLWVHPPQMGGMPRPPFLPYPAVYPGPFLAPARNVALPSVLSLDSQPPGVTPMGTTGAIPMSSAAPGHHLVVTTGIQTELPPPGIDDRTHYHDVTNNGAAFNKQSEVWTAFRTDTGNVYYYNAITGESTYEKPPGFKVEPDKVPMQPSPTLMEYLPGTDWVLVSTNDGKKYYYNSKTKLSSWQIPTEVAELRKKQDDDVSKEHPISVPNTNVLTEKGSSPISLSAPAVNTGGRDATALRTSGVPGSSSALDLIKKKLQDPGAPITSSLTPASSGTAALESNGSRAVEATVKGLQSENSKDKLKDANGDGNVSDSSSDSEDVDSGPTKEVCLVQFKEMLKERGVAPFSKWEKELPKIVFDPRFKAIPSHSARRSLFEHYVKTRAEEERKEKRAAQKVAIEGFKQLLEEASEDIDHYTDYQTFKKKWDSDPRFEALDRKDRELLLNERVLPLKRAAEEKAQAIRVAAASDFKSMLREKGDITAISRWSKVKDVLRNDPRYKSVKHEDREILFSQYIAELKAVEEEAEREAKAKKHEQERLKERERELRKRKEREEQEVERVRVKVRRKEAVASLQALLVETIKDPQASWTESKPKLEKDPQGRATNPDFDPYDIEKLFREHIKILHQRCAHDFKALLSEVVTTEAAVQKSDGKTALNSWSTAKRLLKPDARYNRMPRKDREGLWRRYVEEMLRKQKPDFDQKDEKHKDAKGRSSIDSGRLPSGSRRTRERR